MDWVKMKEKKKTVPLTKHHHEWATAIQFVIWRYSMFQLEEVSTNYVFFIIDTTFGWRWTRISLQFTVYLKWCFSAGIWKTIHHGREVFLWYGTETLSWPFCIVFFFFLLQINVHTGWPICGHYCDQIETQIVILNVTWAQ